MSLFFVNRDDPEVLDKQIEYLDYIDEHIRNVKTAYGNLFLSNDNLILPDYTREQTIEIIDDARPFIMSHDASKYEQEEFDPYRRHFHPTALEKRGETKEEEDAYQAAWKHHYTHNSHHAEFWVWCNISQTTDFNHPFDWTIDSKPHEPIDMDIISLVEMMSDWEAMGMKFKNPTPNYWKNDADDERKAMSENTIKYVDKLIEVLYPKR